MSDIKVLDCTLRDGGYINSWNFGNTAIHGIIKNLEEAKIDIIECGFIRNVTESKDSTVFASMQQMERVISPKKEGVQYAVMIEQHNYNPELINEYSGSGADIIRLTFRKKEWEQAKITVKELMEKGYKVCIQPVGTTSYSDEKLIKLIKDVNELNPFAFYLVDTLGIMYQHDMRRFFYLIDNNLAKNICMGFHSHNNLQMSFANAQEMIRLNHQRTIIIDSSCYGMGRGVGNLCTELLTDYINSNIGQRYSMLPVLNIVDKFLMPIYAEHRWGYDLPYFLAATVKCHPNYAAYLLRKETLSIEKIEKLLSLIPLENRAEFDSELIEEMYVNMQSCAIDDCDSINSLKSAIENRSVLILGAGASIKTYRSKILERIKDQNLYVITVNFVLQDMTSNASFISNEKRLASVYTNIDEKRLNLITSNLQDEFKIKALVFDYSSLLGEGDCADNAGAMLIRILKKCDVRKIYLAGFDGFDVDTSMNYFVTDFKTAMDYDAVRKKNDDISKQLKLALNEVKYELLTPSKYEI